MSNVVDLANWSSTITCCFFTANHPACDKMVNGAATGGSKLIQGKALTRAAHAGPVYDVRAVRESQGPLEAVRFAPLIGAHGWQADGMD